MKKQLQQLAQLTKVLQWTLRAALVGVLAGVASALFLYALGWATNWRESHVWIIGLLPAAGFVIGWMYHRHGKSVEAGNNLLIDEIHDPTKVTPFRMTPLVLVSSVVTHLFGGSAGREGTAVQMGGSLADQLTIPLRLTGQDRRIMLMAGISAGFASVFGTPLAGAVFGFEVLSIGVLRYDAILPCFVAAVIGNRTTLALGIRHSVYSVPFVPAFSVGNFIICAAAGALFGMVGRLFADATHRTSGFFEKRIGSAPLRPVVGGCVVALLVLALRTTKYIGIGDPAIQASFLTSMRPWDFALKFIFTVITLGSGFKGGEVTPLFFIGATLGNVLGPVFGLPPAVLAGAGMVAVFAGAANTPLACTLMAVELFGAPMAIYAGVACVLSYVFSGHAGIYHAQRVGTSKHDHSTVPERTPAP